MTVKQEDRDAAKSIQWVVTTIDDHEAIAKAFALVREAAEQAAAERERELVEQIKADRDTFRDCDILDDPIGAAAQLEAAMRNCDALLAKYGDE